MESPLTPSLAVVLAQEGHTVEHEGKLYKGTGDKYYRRGDTVLVVEGGFLTVCQVAEVMAEGFIKMAKPHDRTYHTTLIARVEPLPR